MRKIVHNIVEIYSVIDVTDNLKRYKVFRKASTPLYEVRMLTNTEGAFNEVTEIFSSNEWDEAKEKGYFLI